MKNKNKIFKIIVLILTILLITVVFIRLNDENIKITKDEKKFKNEYEKLNKTNSNDKKIINVEINKQNNIKYITAKEVIKKLQKGTSIIYFGFPECPWCRNLVPELLKINEEYGMTINYYNALKIRDIKHLDDNGNIVIDKEGTSEYYKIVELLNDYLGEYEGLNNKDIKRLYFPTVVFVRSGKIIGIHIGTVEDQKDPYKKLSSDQKEKLHDILINYFDKLSLSICEQDQKC